jgi:hypothetical protein
LAYQRAVQVYLWGIPAVGIRQYRVANGEAMGGGSDDYKVGYLGGLLKSNIEHLTGNTDSMYIDYMFDTRKGPIVAEVPPALPGFIDDMWELPVVDVIEKVSPSGKYLIVPPGWDGEAPKDHVVARPNTYVSWMLLRGNVEQSAQGPDTRVRNDDELEDLSVERSGKSFGAPQPAIFQCERHEDRPHSAGGTRLFPAARGGRDERAADADRRVCDGADEGDRA